MRALPLKIFTSWLLPKPQHFLLKRDFHRLPSQKLEAPETNFERAIFLQARPAFIESDMWIEKRAKLRKIHTHHAMSGHGGERWLEGAAVDA